jgi:histone deacetylase complex subunit SAP18
MAPERTPALTIRSTGRGFEREILQVRIPGDTANRGGAIASDSSAAPLQRAKNASPERIEKPTEVPTANRLAVDREKVCPLLLRVFPNVGRHYSMAEFAHGNTPSGELQIYTWLDASLKELSGLIREVHPEARLRGTYFEFSLVFPDSKSPSYRARSIGTTRNGQKGLDDNKMLSDVRFQIGDYMIVAITPG